MTSIRERIESLQSVTQFAEILQAGEEWQAGNLIPADEVQARIDSASEMAVREERERCAQQIEEMFSDSDLGAAVASVLRPRKEPDHD